MNYFIDCLTTKYACFSGRARREEYWMFILFDIIFGLAFNLCGSLLAVATGIMAFSLIGSIFNLAVMIPGTAVLFRRLHDTGRSGWWWLIGFIPVVGWIAILVFSCLDGEPGENEYGPNPKGITQK